MAKRAVGAGPSVNANADDGAEYSHGSTFRVLDGANKLSRNRQAIMIQMVKSSLQVKTADALTNFVWSK